MKLATIPTNESDRNALDILEGMITVVALSKEKTDVAQPQPGARSHA